MTADGSVDFGMAHVIPDFIYKAIVKQTPFKIFGDGEQVRTFTHAQDAAEAKAAADLDRLAATRFFSASSSRSAGPVIRAAPRLS